MYNADLIKSQAPSVFTMKRHPEKTTDRYIQIPTTDVLEMFEKVGWITVKAAQARSHDAAGRTYKSHTLRLRHVSSLLENKLQVNGTYPEIIIRNSHDGGSTLRLMAGMFRLVCANGMVLSVGQSVGAIVRHSGENVLEAVMQGGIWVVKEAQHAQESSKIMSRVILTKQEQAKFVREVSNIVTGDAKRFAPAELLAVRREEDAKDSLWNVFNRAQENLVRGGMRMESINGRPSRSRPIVNADRDIKINSALWSLAEKWAA